MTDKLKEQTKPWNSTSDVSSMRIKTIAYHGSIGMTLFQANLGYTPFFLPDLQGYFCSHSAAELATAIKKTQT
ncbi:hypothetical protein DSO57_1009407 [Entomophthora muscae]|uniref:Uncharacterized protein n=1 Tax=Entomophthora muscae TaxID=34485 RepID=A0ACC2U598_9FUNG|nr:hypothetical protein DSO57_1009407 [Entomophthora muscae]